MKGCAWLLLLGGKVGLGGLLQLKGAIIQRAHWLAVDAGGGHGY